MSNLNVMLPASRERSFAQDEIIVSKTDLKGHIQYVNDVFMNVSLYTEKEMLGAPHSIIRNDAMPRCIFKLLWERLADGKEIFAYVVNSCKNGDHYWVLAHVTPSMGMNGNIVGYHSNRRKPKSQTVQNVIIPLYSELLTEEEKHNNAKDGLNASNDLLQHTLKSKGLSYDEFIWSL